MCAKSVYIHVYVCLHLCVCVGRFVFEVILRSAFEVHMISFFCTFVFPLFLLVKPGTDRQIGFVFGLHKKTFVIWQTQQKQPSLLVSGIVTPAVFSGTKTCF